MKSNPYSGWPLFSIRPYMWTPHSLQACLWMAALGSTIASLLPFALTLRLSRVTTATCENSAPFGFQHLVQPHTWLCAHWPLIAISTLFCEQLQYSVPPAKFFAAGFSPPSTAGCILTSLMVTSPSRDLPSDRNLKVMNRAITMLASAVTYPEQSCGVNGDRDKAPDFRYGIIRAPRLQHPRGNLYSDFASLAPPGADLTLCELERGDRLWTRSFPVFGGCSHCRACARSCSESSGFCRPPSCCSGCSSCSPPTLCSAAPW